ncbi:MAG TPA: sodium:glutamate symporter, partial [Myxococcota bacterium]|nr:sodium:glutamate symporter [Myxococcota bacterium]
FEGALSLAYTSATVGILVGVLGGMILINVGIRLGWTRMIHSLRQMPRSMRTGFVPEDEQQCAGRETTSPLAIDPLTWHMAIVVATALLAYEVAHILYQILNISVPVFCIALLLGALVQKIFNIIRIGSYVDRHLIHRIGAMMTDYLVAFGIASISIHVVLSFALPLIIMFAFGTLLSLSFVWFLGRRMCRNFWFERSMILFGWNTGTVAISMILVRVLDPDMKTGVIEDFGISYFGVAFVEIAIISIVPHLVAQGIIISPMLILLAGFFGCIVLSRIMIGWFMKSPTEIRPGEAPIMSGRNGNDSLY